MPNAGVLPSLSECTGYCSRIEGYFFQKPFLVVACFFFASSKYGPFHLPRLLLLDLLVGFWDGNRCKGPGYIPF
jgi:hypothetical protein